MTMAATLHGTGKVSGDLQSLCECPVCLEYYTAPRLLKCGHQFCERCLAGIIDQSPQLNAKCPTCRNITEISEGSVECLPRSTLYQYMQDLILEMPERGKLGRICTKCNTRKPTRHCPKCRDDLSYMCEGCYENHQLVPRLRNHQTVRFDPLLVCGQHPHKMVECFCHQCSKTVCDECIFETHGAHGGCIEDIGPVAETSRDTLRTYIENQRPKLIDIASLKIITCKKAAIEASKNAYIKKTKLAINALQELCSKLKENERSIIQSAEEDIDNLTNFHSDVSKVHSDQTKMLQLAEGLLRSDVSDPQVIMGAKDLPTLKLKKESIVINSSFNGKQLDEIKETILTMTQEARVSETHETIDVRDNPQEWPTDASLRESSRVSGPPACPEKSTQTRAKNRNFVVVDEQSFSPRLCELRISPDFQGYGFDMVEGKGKPGQYIGKVDDGSPAEAAGLREGDRIIEVNGRKVAGNTHGEVIQMIKSSQEKLSLLVVDPGTSDFSRNKPMIKIMTWPEFPT